MQLSLMNTRAFESEENTRCLETNLLALFVLNAKYVSAATC